MKRILFIVCFFILLLSTSSLLASEFISVEEFTKQLMPKTLKRTIGGIRNPDQEPSVSMMLPFKKNSYELTPEGAAQLQNLGKALQKEELKKYIYKIEGHTCDLGEDVDNLKLSHNRALSVQYYLIRTFGFSDKQFTVEGIGERQPLVPNINEANRKKNRRVVIKNTLKTFNSSSDTSIPSMSVQVKRFRNNTSEEVQNGEILTQHDNYAIEFMLKTDRIYVYIYQIDTKGKMTPIFPNLNFSKVSNPVEAGELYRIPEHGKWFYLDESKGKEEIIVIAQKNELEYPEEICKKLLDSSQKYDKTMIASKKASSQKKVTRGVASIREDPLSDKEKAVVKNIEVSNLFIWKHYFIHE